MDGSRWPGAGQGSPGVWGTKGAMAWGYSWVGTNGQAMNYSGTAVDQDVAAFEIFGNLTQVEVLESDSSIIC